MSRSSLSFVAALTLACGAPRALAQVGTAFTYQGQLLHTDSPATGTFDMQFRLFDAAGGNTQIGPTLCSDNVAVTDGLFSISLDFGLQFNGQKRFLEINVRSDTGANCSDDTGFDLLSPRQELTPTPHALFSTSAVSAATATNALNIGGTPAANVATLNGNQTFTGVLNFSNPGNSFTGTLAGNGSGVTALNGSALTAASVARTSLSSELQSVLGSHFTSSPATLIGTVNTGTDPFCVAVQGSYAYVSNSASKTLQVFNISNPASPTLLGSIGTVSTPMNITVSGAYVYMALRNSNQIKIFNVSNPATPTLAGTATATLNPFGIAVSGNYAYLTNDNNQLQIFDVSNSASPVLAGSLNFMGSQYSHSVVIAGSYAYLAGISSNTLRIINISNPASPATAGSIGLGFSPECVAVSGSYAYVVGGGSSLSVFNISNPASPSLVGSAVTASTPVNIAISGTRAYVTNLTSSTLQVFDISNPATPVQLTTGTGVATGTNARGVAASGPYAFVTTENGNTLQVFRWFAEDDNSYGVSGSLFGGGVTIGNYAPTAPVGGLSVAGASTFGSSLSAASLIVSGTGTFGSSVLAASLSTTGAGTFGTSLSAASLGITGSGTVSGNLGIGTNTPGAKLQVVGSQAQILVGDATAAGRIDFARGNDGGATTSIGWLSPTDDTTFRIRNISGGGILQLDTNTATTFLSQGTEKARVISTGTIRNEGAKSSYSGLIETYYAANDRYGIGQLSSGVTAIYTSDFYGPSSIQFGRMTGASSWTSLMTIDHGGNVSTTGSVTAPSVIASGCTLDGTGLHLLGTSQRIQINAASGNSTLRVRGATASDFQVYVERSDASLSFYIDPSGNAVFPGSLAKGGGSFKIDHPLDPENKFLYHSFVESPDMMNIYNGNVITDSSGYATITMPDYFEALNRDFRYQLTVVDPTSFALVRVVDKMQDRQFTIATNLPGIEVSWQVTGIRHDAWAERNRIPNAVDKTGVERGKYLHPEAFDLPVSMGIRYATPTAPTSDSR